MHLTVAPFPHLIVLMLQVRTTWHDLLGRHCPRFGQDRVVSRTNHHGEGFFSDLCTQCLLRRLLCHCLTQKDSALQMTTKCPLHLTVSHQPPVALIAHLTCCVVHGACARIICSFIDEHQRTQHCIYAVQTTGL